MEKVKSNNRLLGWGLFLILSIIWGSSFILIKKALIAFDPIEVACFRIGISFLAFLPFFPFYWKQIPWEKWKPIVVVALAGSGIPAFLYAIAQTVISSSLSGILNSLTPLFALVISVLVFKQVFAMDKMLGVLLGLVGACLLVWLGANEAQGEGYGYGILVILATVCYAVSTNTVKHFFQNLSPLALSVATFCISGPPTVLFLLYQGTLSKLGTVEDAWFSFGAVVALAICSTVIATVLFYKLVQLTNVVFSSTIAYVIPLMAIFLGFLDGEVISPFHFVGMALILIGVYLSRAKQ